MSSAFRRSLPARPDLAQQKKLAKELLQAFRTHDGEAIARIRAELPDKQTISLADAQFVLAREYGFESWRELKDRIDRQRVTALPPMEQFKRYVHEGDAKALGALLERNADVRANINKPIFGFNSPAITAASGRDLDTVDVLLRYGADPNRKSDWWAGGFHALYGASDAVAERLIAAGAVIDACAAAHLDRADLLSAMIAENPQRVHERGGDGKLPLHFARSRRVVDLLLSAGADIDARDIDHRSTAAEWMLGDDPDEARLDLAAYLVERGASADIFLAAALGLTERVRSMLEANPRLLDLRTSEGGYAEKHPSSFHIYQWTIGPHMTPLQVAAKFNQRETVKVMSQLASPQQRLLLACHFGDKVDALAILRDQPDLLARLAPNDRRALANEAWASNAPAVALMLELGFDPAVPGGSSETSGNALHCASWMGSAECVAAILRDPRSHALLDVKDGTYRSVPLGWCVHGSVNSGKRNADYAEVARLLLEAGTTVTADMADWDASDAVQVVLDEALRNANP